jgi:hypothetical protein
VEEEEDRIFSVEGGGLKVGAFAGAVRLFGVKKRRRCEVRWMLKVSKLSRRTSTGADNKRSALNIADPSTAYSASHISCFLACIISSTRRCGLVCCAKR